MIFDMLKLYNLIYIYIHIDLKLYIITTSLPHHLFSVYLRVTLPCPESTSAAMRGAIAWPVICPMAASPLSPGASACARLSWAQILKGYPLIIIRSLFWKKQFIIYIYMCVCMYLQILYQLNH